jgi:hypothetical protein
MKAKIIGSKEAMKIPFDVFMKKGVVIAKGRVELAIVTEEPETFNILKGLEKVSQYYIPTLIEARKYMTEMGIEWEEQNIDKNKNYL